MVSAGLCDNYAIGWLVDETSEVPTVALQKKRRFRESHLSALLRYPPSPQRPPSLAEAELRLKEALTWQRRAKTVHAHPGVDDFRERLTG
jgi:hypothetical protein